MSRCPRPRCRRIAEPGGRYCPVHGQVERCRCGGCKVLVAAFANRGSGLCADHHHEARRRRERKGTK